VDDSIVRGTTCKARVKTLKEARRPGGSRHRQLFPPHRNPCVYGIDFPDRSKLNGGESQCGRNPQIPECRLAALSFGGRHVKATGPRQGIILPGLLWRQYPCPTIPCLTSTSSNAAAAGADVGEPSPRTANKSNCCRFSPCVAYFILHPRYGQTNAFTTAMAAYIDHTLLKAMPPPKILKKLLRRGARKTIFYSVCVNGSWVGRPAIFLEGTASRLVRRRFSAGGCHRCETFRNRAPIDDGAGKLMCSQLSDGSRMATTKLSFVSFATCGAADEWSVKIILNLPANGRTEKSAPASWSLKVARTSSKPHRLQQRRRDDCRCETGCANRRARSSASRASGGIRDTKTALAMIGKPGHPAWHLGGHGNLKGLVEDQAGSY